uniref:Uncharacterized protein n=1 Tax=Timema bartmani TaxID=61472 RepID=A0A7R9I6W9_9NEOP|nr:unnamed protein product [Timema bartmani]
MQKLRGTGGNRSHPKTKKDRPLKPSQNGKKSNEKTKIEEIIPLTDIQTVLEGSIPPVQVSMMRKCGFTSHPVT